MTVNEEVMAAICKFILLDNNGDMKKLEESLKENLKRQCYTDEFINYVVNTVKYYGQLLS